MTTTTKKPRKTLYAAQKPLATAGRVGRDCAGVWPKLYYVVQTVDTKTGEVIKEWTPDEFEVAARMFFMEGREISEHNGICESEGTEDQKENSEVRMIEVEVRPVRRFPM